VLLFNNRVVEVKAKDLTKAAHTTEDSEILVNLKFKRPVPQIPETPVFRSQMIIPMIHLTKIQPPEN